MNDCPFCAILHDGASATILRRGIHSLVIRPLGPVTEGHVLAIPYEHVPDAAADVARHAVQAASQELERAAAHLGGAR